MLLISFRLPNHHLAHEKNEITIFIFWILKIYKFIKIKYFLHLNYLIKYEKISFHRLYFNNFKFHIFYDIKEK